MPARGTQSTGQVDVATLGPGPDLHGIMEARRLASERPTELSATIACKPLLTVPGGILRSSIILITAPRRAAPTSDHHAILYKMYHQDMTSVTLSDFRSRQADLIAAAQREPVEITSRGAGRRAVVVSPEFYDRALQALEDQADIRAAAAAREETERVSHEDLVAELGL